MPTNKTPLRELLTASNLVALDRLACLLARLPDDYNHFDMADYNRRAQRNGEGVSRKLMREPQDIDPADTLCGTVACAVGHLPYLGYVPEDAANFSWTEYSQQVTGLPGKGYEHNPTMIGLWDWCFSSEWARGPIPYRTPRHAAMRIAFVLDHYDTCDTKFGDTLHSMVRETLIAMEAIGELRLIGERCQVHLELSNPYLVSITRHTSLTPQPEIT